MNTTIQLKGYLAKGKTFVIPYYQRGYVWGKQRNGEDDSVTYLMKDIRNRYESDSELFLQGFTVTERKNEIVIIDGQQRTTCLYLLFKYLGYNGKFDIHYEIRKESNSFLNSLDLLNIQEQRGEEFQDVYFFKKTLRIIAETFGDVDKEKLIGYLLDKVKFLYIHIDEAQAQRVFTMMNGSKAQMRQEEIIKAEMLRLVSMGSENESESVQWELNMLRSRYAREWDKWLYWWNRHEVQTLYRCSNPMGLLIKSLYNKEGLTFERFRKKFFKSARMKEAKDCFDKLRRLQKRFEDAYNTPEIHNNVGAILALLDYDSRRKFIQYYFVEEKCCNLNDYYLQVFIGMTHDEITNRNVDKFSEKYESTLKAISDDFAYINSREDAFRLLLRLNIEQDTIQGRNFNFDIWRSGNRSLEHIQAKSKVVHRGNDGKWYRGDDQETDCDDGYMKRDEIKATVSGKDVKTTEHSIGNLVLLYKNENSKFNDSDFYGKKRMFFSPKLTDLFRSRHLLHTMCVFAERPDWNGEAIAINKVETIKKFKNDYEALRKEYGHDKKQQD